MCHKFIVDSEAKYVLAGDNTYLSCNQKLGGAGDAFSDPQSRGLTSLIKTQFGFSLFEIYSILNTMPNV